MARKCLQPWICAVGTTGFVWIRTTNQKPLSLLRRVHVSSQGRRLDSAPSSFQRMTEIVLSGLNLITCFCYLDDVIIHSKDQETTVSHKYHSKIQTHGKTQLIHGTTQ